MHNPALTNRAPTGAEQPRTPAGLRLHRIITPALIAVAMMAGVIIGQTVLASARALPATMDQAAAQGRW